MLVHQSDLGKRMNEPTLGLVIPPGSHGANLFPNTLNRFIGGHGCELVLSLADRISRDSGDTIRDTRK